MTVACLWASGAGVGHFPELPAEGDARLEPELAAVEVSDTEAAPLVGQPGALQVSLLGTEPGRNNSEGRALIKVGDRAPVTYVAGATLPSGHRILDVTNGAVTLERDEVRTTLPLRTSVGLTKAQTQPGAMKPTGPDELHSAGGAELLTRHVRLSAEYQGNRLNGYEVRSRSGSQALTRLGLHDGDVIVAVNDVPLDDSQTALSMLGLVAGAPDSVWTIRRDDRVFQSVVRLSDFESSEN